MVPKKQTEIFRLDNKSLPKDTPIDKETLKEWIVKTANSIREKAGRNLTYFATFEYSLDDEYSKRLVDEILKYVLYYDCYTTKSKTYDGKICIAVVRAK